MNRAFLKVLFASGLAGVWAISVGCGNPPALLPDGKSGPDQSWETPVEVDLDVDEGEGEAEMSDSVTFPGGDRVDWKMITLPKDGVLTITLNVRPARPGLTAEANLLDDGFRIIKKTKAGSDTKKIKIKEAEKGKYYLQIYAPKQSDAALYDLSIHYKENPPDLGSVAGAPPPQFGVDLLPDPEPLAGTPEIAVVVPPGGVPPGGVPPGGVPPGGVPPGGTPGVPPGGVPGGVPPGGTPPGGGEEEPPPEPVIVTIQDMAATATGTLLIVGAGTNKKIAVGWKGKLLKGKTDKPLANGDVKVKKVFGTTAQVETKLSIDAIGENTRIKLEP